MSSLTMSGKVPARMRIVQPMLLPSLDTFAVTCRQTWNIKPWVYSIKSINTDAMRMATMYWPVQLPYCETPPLGPHQTVQTLDL